MIADLIATADDAVDDDESHAAAAAAADSGSASSAPASTSAHTGTMPQQLSDDASMKPRRGFVVGVDVVAHRLAICKTLV